MPSLPISQLPAASLPLSGSELFAAVQNGVTKYTVLNNMLYVQGNNYGLFNQTGSSIPVTGSNYSGSLLDGGIGTLSVPANGFKKGDCFSVTAQGKLTITNGHTLEIHFESNGVNLVDTGVISMPKISNKNWRMEVNFSINEIGDPGVASIASAGTIWFRTDSAGDVVTEIFSSINNTTFDTTIANTLQVKAILANLSPSDSIYSQLFTLRKIY